MGDFWSETCWAGYLFLFSMLHNIFFLLYNIFFILTAVQEFFMSFVLHATIVSLQQALPAILFQNNPPLKSPSKVKWSALHFAWTSSISRDDRSIIFPNACKNACMQKSRPTNSPSLAVKSFKMLICVYRLVFWLKVARSNNKNVCYCKQSEFA